MKILNCYVIHEHLKTDFKSHYPISKRVYQSYFNIFNQMILQNYGHKYGSTCISLCQKRVPTLTIVHSSLRMEMLTPKFLLS